MSAASDALASRIRDLIGNKPGLVEKKMFGGTGFMLDGNMVAGTTAKGLLMVRVDPQGQAAALKRTGAIPIEMGTHTMKGFIGVAPEAIETAADLSAWLDWSGEYVRTLPPK